MGKGLHESISMAALRSFRQSKDLAKAAMLETIPAGASWPLARILQDIGGLQSTMCSRCGLEEETDFHVLWICPCNKEIEDPAVSKTHYL